MREVWGRLRGWAKTLVVIEVLFGIAGTGLYAVVTFSAKTINSYSGLVLSGAAQYRWAGGELLIERDKAGSTMTCTAKPDNGEERKVPTVYLGKVDHTGAIETARPWFTGGATVTCHSSSRDTVKIYTGSMVKMRTFAASAVFF